MGFQEFCKTFTSHDLGIEGFQALSDEQDFRFGEATLALIFLIKNFAPKNGNKFLPNEIVAKIEKSKLGQIRTKKDLGENLLRLHLIKIIFENKLEKR